MEFDAIEFKYMPNQQLASMLMSIVSNYGGMYISGMLPAGRRLQIQGMRLYAVCHATDKNGRTINEDLMAIVAVSDTEAQNLYAIWNNKSGNCIGILEDDAARANVIACGA